MILPLATLLSALALAALTACGGGGGDTGVAAGPVTPPVTDPAATPPDATPVATAPVVPPTGPDVVAPVTAPYGADLVTTVAATTYPDGSASKGAWDALQTARSTCGFGKVSQDTRLDVANNAHAYYNAKTSADLINNNQYYFSHYQVAPTATTPSPYFSGVNWDDRAQAAGWPSTSRVTEIISMRLVPRATTNSTGALIENEASGSSLMNVLLSLPYHLSGGMTAGRYAGVGSNLQTATKASTGSLTDYLQVGALISAEDSNRQKIGSKVVATYPCAGVTAALAVFRPATELPNPFPSITSTSTSYGTPVYAKVDSGQILVVNSTTIKKVLDGVAVPIATLTQATDPNRHFKSNEFLAVPTVALAKSTDYAVEIVGTVDGAAFTKNFTFTTSAL